MNKRLLPALFVKTNDAGGEGCADKVLTLPKAL